MLQQSLLSAKARDWFLWSKILF